MDAIVDTVLSHPLILIGIAAAIFIVALVMIIGRLFSFVFTCILIAAAALSGYTLLNYSEVQNYLRDSYEERTGRDLPDIPEEEKSKSLSDYGSEAWDWVKGLSKSEEKPSDNNSQQ